MKFDDIEDYVPSILNPRRIRQDGKNLTQGTQRCSLSLKLKNTQPSKPSSQKAIGKENVNNYNIPVQKRVPKRLAALNNNNDENNIKVTETLYSGAELLDIDHSVNKENSTAQTIAYEYEDDPLIVSFDVKNCDMLDLSTNSCFKKVMISRKDNDTKIDCEMVENSIISIESDDPKRDVSCVPSPPKKSAIAVNLEIKRTKRSEIVKGNSKVLILNTDAIERLSNVIVQPPNYNLVKRQITDRGKFRNSARKKTYTKNRNKVVGDNLIQTRIQRFFNKRVNIFDKSVKTVNDVTADDERKDVVVMSRNLASPEPGKSDRSGKVAYKRNESPRTSPKKDPDAPKRNKSGQEGSRGHNSPKVKLESGTPHTPRKKVDSTPFSLPSGGSRSNKNTSSILSKQIPHYKIVSGTNFAVDAFSFGDIPNIKYYFLTHFHSDHYAGLKKTFNKFILCSKITANLCVSRLGVNPKTIHILNCDESITLDNVEITAVDANHCPGAIMLIFTLPNGKSLLHTGDFRASPTMESYPIFWNKDIYSVYLDTTYCNPRYDFPTQDESLEMALYLLRQKKMALEKAGKKFSTVLIICGTYTIGKEKFFLGMARRVGCSVWACPEKDRVLQVVEGRSFTHAPPHTCQLHVVPMRDLTHEKLRCYLDSLQGAFTEVVAFKPSGWENGKNTTVEKDMITIHGIPYSEHSSFSEMIRFVKFLQPKQVTPTVDISGGVKAVQKYFPCPLLTKDGHSQQKLTDYYSIGGKQVAAAVT